MVSITVSGVVLLTSIATARATTLNGGLKVIARGGCNDNCARGKTQSVTLEGDSDLYSVLISPFLGQQPSHTQTATIPHAAARSTVRPISLPLLPLLPGT